MFCIFPVDLFYCNFQYFLKMSWILSDDYTHKLEWIYVWKYFCTRLKLFSTYHKFSLNQPWWWTVYILDKRKQTDLESAAATLQTLDLADQQQISQNTNLPLETYYVIISQNVPCGAYRVLTWELQTETMSPPHHHPRHPFLESSPGETVQCLNRSILIHDTTFEQKKNIFIFFYQGAKKENVRFSIVSSSAFWLCDVRCVLLPRGGDDTFRWKWKCVLAVEVVRSFFVMMRGLSSG